MTPKSISPRWTAPTRNPKKTYHHFQDGLKSPSLRDGPFCPSYFFGTKWLQHKLFKLQNCHFYNTLRPHPHTTTPSKYVLVQGSPTSQGGWCTMCPRAPCRGLSRCSIPMATTAMKSLWRQAHNDSLAITPTRHWQLLSHASDRRRSWFVTPGIWPVVTWAYSTWHNGGGSHAAKPPPPSPPSALPLGATPPGNPTAWWATRSQAAPASRPPDGDNGAPHPVALIIDLITMLCGGPISRPAQGSTIGIARGGGGAGAAPLPPPWVWRRQLCREGKCCNAAPLPHPYCGAAILAEGVREFIRNNG